MLVVKPRTQASSEEAWVQWYNVSGHPRTNTLDDWDAGTHESH